MFGGPSQVDTFDPKPALERHHGQPVSSVLPGVTEIKTFFGDSKAGLMRSPFRFAKHGQSGIEVSELFPNVAGCVDDLCVIRSLYGDSNNHAPATFQLNTGAILPGKPSLGSWLTYGLGTENRNLPAFVVMIAVLWMVLDGMGVFGDLNRTVRTVLGESGSSFDLMRYVGFSRVLSLATVIGVIDVFLLTALSTLGAFLYNICSALVGGVQVTLTDD